MIDSQLSVCFDLGTGMMDVFLEYRGLFRGERLYVILRQTRR